MSDVESTPPDETPRRQPGWLAPVGVGAAVVALALASFGLGRTTGGRTVHVRPAEMSQMMQGQQGQMTGGRNGMPMMPGNGMMPWTTTTTAP